ncbi:hypothetical protein TCAL_05983 [Tigriopus californicus]|uniref:Granulins domain-containing protein n=1 Tax=Tigriopus californicus TaxID=6832 RepID=A0A553PPU2_TIGCA|nr:progranulin-like [Tigriopus californicus]TRY79704.1 hypothetical protein TCAL_05983 [Tigriopus californicus]
MTPFILLILAVGLQASVSIGFDLPLVPQGLTKSFCPDKEFYCNDGQTCCEMTHGFGCCPMPKATCCKDRTHCCPHGTVCNTKAGSCTQSFGLFQHVFEVPSVRSPLQRDSLEVRPVVESLNEVVLTNGTDLIARVRGQDCGNTHVECEDGLTCCPFGNTCCRRMSGEFACCQVSNGVCCETLDKCCPEGFTCTGNINESCASIRANEIN